MSELKEHLFVPYSELQEGDELTDAITIAKSYCLKSEADNVIADLEKSHKMEVEQLLMEIAELKEKLKNSRNARKYWRKEYLIEHKEARHQKYKRCLAMAEWCNSGMVVETFACFRPRSTKEVWREEHKYWAKWRKIWFELAMKFKEA